MKRTKIKSYLALMGLGMGAAAAPALHAQGYLDSGSASAGAITSATTPLVQNYDGLTHNSNVTANSTTPPGSPNLTSLPGYSELTGTPNNFQYRGLSDGTSGTGGYFSYGLSGDPDRALGFLEQGSTELREARASLEFQNSTGATIDRLLIKYDIELWRDGARRNRLRLRYSDDQNPGINTDANWSAILVDIGAVQNAGGDVVLNGNNYVTTGSTVVFLNNAVDQRGALTNGNYASLRWQYSATAGEDSGSRDGLGLDNVSIQVLKSGTDRTWSGASNGVWSTGVNNWTSGTQAWDNSADLNARFVSGAGTPVRLTSSGATAVDLLAVSGAYSIIPDSGTPILTLKGIVDTTVAFTAGVPIDVDTTVIPGLYKLGSQKLTLNHAGNLSTGGGLNVEAGTVELGVADAIDSTPSDPTKPNFVAVSSGATFAVNGKNTTLNGLRGATGSFVTLGSSGSTLLTLDVPTGVQNQHRGTLSGTLDTLVKTGPGLQKFQTANKTFVGKVLVEDGILDLTDDGDLTAITDLRVTAVSGKQGELAFTTDETSNENFSFPVPIELESGYLRAESEGGVTLTSNVQLVSGESRIYSSGDVGHEFHITGTITGSGDLRKNGSGELYLDSSGNTYTGETEINNGKIIVPATGSLGGGKLWITDPDEARELILQKSVTVAGLEGNSQELPDPQTGYITLDGNITFTINQGAALDAGEEVKPSYQGDFREVSAGDAGLVVKTGLGTTRLTRQPKAFTGHVEVNNGVLETSGDGQFTDVAEIEVNSGGQLRLTSGSNDIGAPVVYDFGGDVVLRSTARTLGGVITANSGFGELGGLRVDGNTVVTPPEEPELFTELASNVVIASASDIHINGVDAVLFLSGTLSGSATLERTGGGELAIVSNASYTGTMTLTNGITSIADGVSFGGAIVVNAGELRFSETATLGGSLDVNAGTVKVSLPSAVPGSAMIPVTGSADLAAPVVIDLGETGDIGIYPVFDPTGTATVNGGVSVINPPSGLTASVYASGGVIFVELQ